MDRRGLSANQKHRSLISMMARAAQKRSKLRPRVIDARPPRQCDEIFLQRNGTRTRNVWSTRRLTVRRFNSVYPIGGNFKSPRHGLKVPITEVAFLHSIKIIRSPT